MGVNNIISMKELKRLEGIGFEKVSTYINSGNVISTTKEPTRARSMRGTSKRRSRRCWLASSSLRQMWCEVWRRWRNSSSLPAGWGGDSEWRYNVMFLRHTIDSEKILDELTAKGDHEQIVYRPRWNRTRATTPPGPPAPANLFSLTRPSPPSSTATARGAGICKGPSHLSKLMTGEFLLVV